MVSKFYKISKQTILCFCQKTST